MINAGQVLYVNYRLPDNSRIFVLLIVEPASLSGSLTEFTIAPPLSLPINMLGILDYYCCGF